MATDTDFFGIQPLGRIAGAHRFRIPIVEHLTRLDGKLYGGTAIGVSVATAEAVTGAVPVWMTTQFVSTVELGNDMDVTVEVLAAGRRTNQVRVTGTAPSGAVVFASLGATGVPKEGGINGEFDARPSVPSPSDAPEYRSPFAAMAEKAGMKIPEMRTQRGFTTEIEMRAAPIGDATDEERRGHTCLWARRRGGGAITPAIAAYIADMVPMSVARAAEVVAGGTSLDNTIRIGNFRPTEWLLMDLRPHLAAGSYGHGIAHLWNEHGDLLATASQTASMMTFDPANPPWADRTT